MNGSTGEKKKQGQVAHPISVAYPGRTVLAYALTGAVNWLSIVTPEDSQWFQEYHQKDWFASDDYLDDRYTHNTRFYTWMVRRMFG